MKIKLAVLDQDLEFINRFMKAFQQKYSEKISLSIFSNENNFFRNLEESHIDIALIDQSMKIDVNQIPENITVGYLGNTLGIEEKDGFPVICKYQRVDIIYKLILDVYANNSSNIKLEKKNTDARIVLFTSVQGGAGTSTAAAAYSMKKTLEKKRVFYLNLEKFGDTGLYFSTDDVQSFSDVIYALKSKKSNIVMKLESISRVDASGVEFFNPCKNAYDMVELQDVEIKELIHSILQIKEYDEIVIDISGDMTERMLMLMKDYANLIVYVSDGSITGNRKFEKFCQVVHVMEQRQKINILNKTCLLYNRYSSKTSTQVEKSAVSVVGGIHRFEGIAEKELMKKVAQADALNHV